MRFHLQYILYYSEWLLKIYVFGCAYFHCTPNSCLGCDVRFWKTCANNAICFETPCQCICWAFGTLWKSEKEFYPNFYEDHVNNWKLCFVYDKLLFMIYCWKLMFWGHIHVIISSKIGAIHRGGVIKASYASKWWKQNFWCDKSSDGPDYKNMQNGLTPKDFFLFNVLRLNHIQRLVVEL